MKTKGIERKKAHQSPGSIGPEEILGRRQTETQTGRTGAAQGCSVALALSGTLLFIHQVGPRDGGPGWGHSHPRLPLPTFPISPRTSLVSWMPCSRYLMDFFTVWGLSELRSTQPLEQTRPWHENKGER